MTALTTEQFVLQSAASTAVTEASARASLYVLTLSSSLVAIGFAVQTDAFAPLVSTILPVIVVLGLFTTVRLVDTSVENVQLLSAIAHIRSYYRTLAPDAASYFPAAGPDEAAEALASLGVKRGPSAAMFTMASMISLINSVVAAACVTLLTAQWWRRPVAFASGVVVAIAFTTVFFRYQSSRYRQFRGRSAEAENRHATPS